MKPQICTVITGMDSKTITGLAPLSDLFEVRIDLIGEGWSEVIGQLNKPWIATNRLAIEGGKWQESEARRKEELLKAIELGASYVDIELATPNLDKVVALFKKRVRCIISYHNTTSTPAQVELKAIVKRQIDTGADICKAVGTATTTEDNLNILKLIGEFPGKQIIAFNMGVSGTISRILSPLAGSPFTYAAIKKGGESAPGQLTVRELAEYYSLLP